jgi:hypothetical protein
MPTRIFLPAVGGAALAAARQDRRADVERLAEMLRAKTMDFALPYASAASQTDMAEACALIGDTAAAAAFRDAACSIADAYHYHELSHRIAQLTLVHPAPAAPILLASETLGIGEAVRQLAGAHA